MEFLLQNRYRTLTFDELDNFDLTKTHEKIVLITFDDGYISNYTTVYPFLKGSGLKFNIFLSTYEIQNENKEYISKDMIREMHNSKYVGFGAHTYSHIDSRLINDDNFEKQVIYANDFISNLTGTAVEDFCFPFGYYNNDIISYLAHKNVYKRLYTSDYMPLNKVSGTTVIGRIGIENDDNLSRFIKKINGWYDIMYYFS